MKVTTLLPLMDNQGDPVPTEKIKTILKSLAVQFSGCSTDGKVDGHSVDEGIEHSDISLRVTVVCAKERLDELRQRIVEVGRELKQSSMYFEVRDYDGVQFLSTQQPR
ncbi:hypothetical protein [Schlesneria paludicola]|uniref:hypothetical protein n=1 Tax=Schlesneria paludicola TaxID=360056 RepID=UPI00029B5782|nr:hypothetical protein [Schlesneria paludicola]